MNNITIGQYVPGDSWIYKLDPRTKILLTILSIVMIFIIPNLECMILALGIFLVIFLSTRVSLVRVLRGLKGVIFLLAFTFALQLIYNKEGNILYTFEMQISIYHTIMILGILVVYFLTKRFIKFKLIYTFLMLGGIFSVLWLVDTFPICWATFNFDVYDVGLKNASFIFIRIFMMIGITSLLTVSTMSTDINNGLEWVLSPLKVIKVPVSVLSMTISLTLRFIPTLYEETRKIMNAQASRGVDFQEGKLKDKVTQIISLLVPMFVISFKRAEDLSNAMEARGYVIGAKRTRIDELKFKALDIVSFIIGLALLGVTIFTKVYF